MSLAWNDYKTDSICVNFALTLVSKFQYYDNTHLCVSIILRVIDESRCCHGSTAVDVCRTVTYLDNRSLITVGKKKKKKKVAKGTELRLVSYIFKPNTHTLNNLSTAKIVYTVYLPRTIVKTMCSCENPSLFYNCTTTQIL